MTTYYHRKEMPNGDGPLSLIPCPFPEPRHAFRFSPFTSSQIHTSQLIDTSRWRAKNSAPGALQSDLVGGRPLGHSLSFGMQPTCQPSGPLTRPLYTISNKVKCAQHHGESREDIITSMHFPCTSTSGCPGFSLNCCHGQATTLPVSIWSVPFAVAGYVIADSPKTKVPGVQLELGGPAGKCYYLAG